MSSTANLHPSDFAFPSLALSGVNGYEIQGDRVVITISEISNHRDFGNLSGTLAIELWALSRPYHGGPFEGVALAGTQIGQVSGQHLLTNGRYELPFTEPAPGTWYLTLMLREWEGAGFVTRDHIGFAQPYTVSPALAPAVLPPTAIESPLAPAPAPAPATENRVLADTPEPLPKAVKASALDQRVSINAASLAEIAAIKGVSKKLAEAIVAARPFVGVDALLPVKGMGPKLLEKLRPLIRL